MELRQIIFTEKDTAKLLKVKAAELGEYDVMVKTSFSTVSCGTERANISGDLNVNASAEPEEEAVFPRTAGYSSAGIVIKKGEKAKSVGIGDRVVVFWGKHINYNIVPEAQVVKIENDEISLEEAAISFIAAFSLAGIRKTRLETGESALVMGLGLLGQLAVQFARAAGAVPIVAADPIRQRREEALKYGADYALDPLEKGFADRVKKLTGGVNAAIEGTGCGAGLDGALDCMAPLGRIALLGCTRKRDFTIDYYRKIHFPGITIVGAHTQARPKSESYPGYFTHQDDIKAVLKLCAGGRIGLRGMIAETHSPTDCGEVYARLVREKDFPSVVQFDWSGLEEA